METERSLLVLWTTSRCNLKCRYCYAAQNEGADMTWETAKLAIDRMGSTPFRIQFAGGEPTLNLPLIRQIAEYVRDKKIPLSIQTNAVDLSDECLQVFRKYHIAVGVSMDGRGAVNERLRGRTIQALDGVFRLRCFGIRVNLNAVVTAENVKNLPDLVDLAAYLGNVGGIGLDLLRNAGRAALPGAPAPASDADIAQALRRMAERVKKINRLLPQPVVLREIEEARRRLEGEGNCGAYCYASLGRCFVVLPQGDVYPCGSLAGNAKYYMGNVRGGLRPVCLPGARPLKCVHCKYNEMCPGGCPSRSLLSGGFSSQDCALRRAAFELAEQELFESDENVLLEER